MYANLGKDHANAEQNAADGGQFAIVQAQFIDVNGDGLPDKVVDFKTWTGVNDQYVYLNNGCDWVDARTIDKLVMCTPKVEQATSLTALADPRVGAFLGALNLTHYAVHFANHEVDYETLLSMHQGHLEGLGITALGARLKIIKAAARARREDKARLVDATENLNCALSTDSYQLPGNAGGGAYDPDRGQPMNVRDGGNGKTVMPIGTFQVQHKQLPARAAVLLACCLPSRCACSQDINGDGLPDLIFSVEEESSDNLARWNRRCVYLNTGSSWELVGSG